MSLKELFDFAYAMKTPDGDCRNCEKFTCQNTCEPGATNSHGENLLLLPGEFEYIAERLGETPKWLKHGGAGDVEVGFVPPGHACPYWEGGKCQIFENRPIRCRSYPMLATKEDESTLRVWSAQQCPKAMSTAKDTNINQHHTAWIGIWKGLMSTVPNEWWDMAKKLMPGGCLHLFDYVDDNAARAGDFSEATIKSTADPNCELCDGEGRLSDNGLCSCVTKHLKSEIENNSDSIFH